MGPQVSARLQCTVIPPLLSYTLVAFNQAARLMHSFIKFQGQVLHLVQGDTCLFNYVDNLITFYSQGLGLGEVHHFDMVESLELGICTTE